MTGGGGSVEIKWGEESLDKAGGKKEKFDVWRAWGGNIKADITLKIIQMIRFICHILWLSTFKPVH